MNIDDINNLDAKNLLKCTDIQTLEIFVKSNKLPPIVVNKENMETYLNYFECMSQLSDSFGKNVIFLFACVCNVYNIDPEIPFDSNPHRLTIEKFIGPLALLTSSLIQSQDAIKVIRASKGFTTILNGDKFCFIVYVLQYLYEKYVEMACTYMGKKDLTDSELKSMNGSLKLLKSDEMVELKKAFKVIECFECLEDKVTLH